MNQVAVLKRLTIVQKPLIECAFKTPANSTLPFETPIPTPQKLKSFSMWTENEEQEQSMTDGDEESRKTD